mgnify:CR=1 FL=1
MEFTLGLTGRRRAIVWAIRRAVANHGQNARRLSHGPTNACEVPDLAYTSVHLIIRLWLHRLFLFYAPWKSGLFFEVSSNFCTNFHEV